MAIDAAKPHLTQFPEAIRKFSSMSDTEMEKAMSDPNNAWWSEPMTLIFGKATVPVQPWEAIFLDVEPRQKQPRGASGQNRESAAHAETNSGVGLALGDPWRFYDRFRAAHKLMDLPVAAIPEIALKEG